MKTATLDSIFISYSRKDDRWLTSLQTMLGPMCKRLRIPLWSDRAIEPGYKWDNEIKNNLRRAKIAVLLVSPHFLESAFISNVELPTLLKAQDRKGTVILWVPVSACPHEHTELAQYQAAFDPARPLDSMRPYRRNQVLSDFTSKVISQFADGSRS